MSSPPVNQSKFSMRKRRNVVYSIVFTIALLLIINFGLIYHNSQVIMHNVKMQEETDRVKVNTEGILRNLHQIDMGLRGYALIRSERQFEVIQTGYVSKDKIFNALEGALHKQGYAMNDFYHVRDSINIYYDTLHVMEKLIAKDKNKEFIALLKKDYGNATWLTYRSFAHRINNFEDNIAKKAATRYQAALRNSYLLQIVIFMITVPALFFMAYYTVKSLRDSESLRIAEAEKNIMLSEQKVTLERLVYESTKEIQMQNEEITAQNEEIVSHNELLRIHRDELETRNLSIMLKNKALQVAQTTIEEQNGIIHSKNLELKKEVEDQTRDIKQTNAELIGHNSRLEQFTYIISHNLRAPLARVIGLSNILAMAKTEKEKTEWVGLILKSTTELEAVFKDLTQILAIQKSSTQISKKINLEEVLLRVKNALRDEIKETGTEIKEHWEEKILYSIPPYIESILYNLISNSIKYRHPERLPAIEINSALEGDFLRLTVKDNCLGIDLKKNGKNLFNLYKRFHFHVEGKGLGLYLVRTQVESLGGNIQVESEAGKGSIFYLYFKAGRSA